MKATTDFLDFLAEKVGKTVGKTDFCLCLRENQLRNAMERLTESLPKLPWVVTVFGNQPSIVICLVSVND